MIELYTEEVHISSLFRCHLGVLPAQGGVDNGLKPQVLQGHQREDNEEQTTDAEHGVSGARLLPSQPGRMSAFSGRSVRPIPLVIR